MSSSSQESTQEAREIREEIDGALAKRSVSGGLAYLVLMTVFFLATPAVSDHPTGAVVQIGWFVALVLVRLALARTFATSYPRHPRRWAMTFRVVTLLLGLSWGIACALWTRALGHSFATIIVIISTAGVAAGGMTALGPSVGLAHAYIGCILGPSLVGFALAGDGSREAIGLAASFVLFGAFLVIEARRVHQAFVLAVRKTHLLGQRAGELAERTRRMKELLDTVGQGFLSVKPDGSMASERSAILERWLGPCRDDEPVWAYLGRTAPTAAIWLRMGLDTLVADELPSELVIAQLPQRIRAGERYLDLEYRPTMVDGKVSSLLMILSDVTSEVERRRSDEEQHDLMRIFQHMRTDRRAVVEFVAEANRLAADLATSATASNADVLRWIHTLKGNTGLFGLTALARLCHDLETSVAESGEPVSPQQRAELAQAWHAAARRIDSFLGGDTREVDVARAEYLAVIAAVESGAPRVEIVDRLRRWELEPSERRLARIAEQARDLARRLGKGDIDVVVEPNDLRLPPERLGGFWSAFVHIVRNAVDHGLEAPGDRVALGKPAHGQLTVRTFVDASEFVVSLEDDGRGIDWDRVADSARSRGLACTTRAELEAALYAPGVSTAEVVTEISGRGIGMASVRTEVHNLGGHLALESERRRGTRWMARFPRSVLAA